MNPLITTFDTSVAVPADTVTHSMNQVATQFSLSVFADWFTIIGLILTIIGLGLTWNQGRKTKKAAEAAQESAVKTAEKMESFQFTASLAMNVEKLKTCHILLKESKWDEVARHLIEARDQLIKVRESLNQNSTDSSVRDELSLLRDLKESMNYDIKELHSKSLNDEYQLTMDTIYDHINSVHEFFIAKQSQIKKK